ncbi:MAG: GNAT family N-acetyltransferase [Deinococcus sp.]|nr:GNAT family N-acetyltransferase [Deinococcus sp.]
MLEIIDAKQHPPTEEQARAFARLISADEQRRWEYSSEGVSEPGAVYFFAVVLPARPDQEVLLAVDGQEVAGMVAFRRRPESYEQHCATLGIGVAKGYQRRGVGTKLFQAALDLAHRCQVKRLEIDCFSDNLRAIGLYRKMGFVEEGVRRQAVYKDGVYRDVLLMARWIGEED